MTDKTDKVEKIENVCRYGYDLLLISFLIYRVFYNTMFRKDFQIGRFEIAELAWILAAFLIIAIKVFYLRLYSRMELIVMVILILLSFIAAKTSDTYWLSFFPLLAAGAKKVPFDRILKIYIMTVGAMLIVTAVAAQAGLITNLVYLQPEMDGSGAIRVRSSFGTTYPTTFSEFIFFLCASAFYLRRKRLSWPDPVLLFAVAAFLLYFCDARTDLLSVAFLSAAALWALIRKRLPDRWKERFHKLSAILIIAMPALAAAVILGAWLYYPGSRVLSKVNDILNTRLALGRKGFRKYGLTWFGTFVKYRSSGGKLETVKHYFNLDSSYLMVLINFGILLFIVLILLFCFSSFRAWEEKDFVLLAVLTVIALECLMENRLIQAQFNIFLLIFFADLIKDDSSLWCMIGDFRIKKKENPAVKKGES